jgi:hypothetical protein
MLKVRGRLSARGGSIPLELEAQLHRVDGELEIEAAVTAPHRELGMIWSPLGMIRPRSELLVKGRLTPSSEEAAWPKRHTSARRGSPTARQEGRCCHG